jgi:sodium/bile acid cotransporter 7
MDLPFAGTKGQVLLDLFLLLLFPFALGQILRPLIKGFMERRQIILYATDRLAVIFIVFVSFSHATVSGLWKSLSLWQFLLLLLSCGLILTLALALTYLAGKKLNFSPSDRAAILFCGSKKSLMAGVPMAGIIFSPSVAAVVILPLMIFHQLQLLVCAQIARSYAKKNTNLPDVNVK